jgi:signal transduction histidine kinase
MSQSPVLTDQELLIELKNRLDAHHQMLEEQRSLLSQLHAVNEKLLASEKLKSGFLSNIRNEINNPIASVMELSRQMANDELSAEKIQKYAGLIHSEAFSLSFQLQNIFYSADVEAGTTMPQGSSTLISHIIENVMGNFKALADKKQVKITFSNQLPDAFTFNTDSEKLYLILSNLISNAIQFSKEESDVVITAAEKNGKLILSIADNGMGISKEDQPRIYDRFSQLDQGVRKNHGGHGLGLSLVKSLIDLLEGEISLRSELGKGSEFTISIPPVLAIAENEMFSSDGNDFLFGSNDQMTF